MTPARPRAFTLFHTLMAVTLAGVALSIGMPMIMQSIGIQKRVSMWVNDDAVTQQIIRQVRRDMSSANQVEIVQDQSLVLRLRGPVGQVRYENTPDGIVRLATPTGRTPSQSLYPLRRSVIDWRCERIDAGGTIIWLVVEIRDPVGKQRGKTVTMSQRYATAFRPGISARQEDVR